MEILRAEVEETSQPHRGVPELVPMTWEEQHISSPERRHNPSTSLHSAIETIGRSHQLTPGEMRVLQALVEVGGIRDISAALAISPTTVKTHLRHIFQKTGAKGQAALIRMVVGVARSSGQ
jgi:DNA-binding CsgD family transcriptional regulator